MADKYYGISPYLYCAGNPVLYVDPTGKIFETLWDIANVAMDAKSLVSNIKAGNLKGALLDGAIYEVKDVKYISNTRQIRAERELARSQHKDFMLVVGENTKLAGTLSDDIKIRMPEIGPKQ